MLKARTQTKNNNIELKECDLCFRVGSLDFSCVIVMCVCVCVRMLCVCLSVLVCLCMQLFCAQVDVQCV